MKSVWPLATFAAAVLVSAGTLAAQSPSPAPGPRELYQALNALRVSPREVYYVRRLDIRRDVVRISLDEGKLAFLESYQGRLAGAVFTGEGYVLALLRDPLDKAQLARFLDVPVLNQRITTAYFRFTDNTGEELRRKLREAGAQPAEEPSFADEWNSAVQDLSPWHSLRILRDWLAAEPQPYFYAGVVGEKTGPFDVLIDDRRPEQVVIGQPRWVEGVRYYDVWASFRRAGASEEFTLPFASVAYALDTTILTDRTLEGTATLTLKAARSGERVIPLELARRLAVQSVEDAQGQPLVFFQNEEMNPHEIAERGNDALFVVLPAAPRPGEEFRLRIHYRGSVIRDAGNGVYFVSDRGSWYPHIAGTCDYARYEMTFRWPRRLQLVATGKKLDEREEGEQRVGRWRSEVPIPVAGFNLGEYATATVRVDDLKIELYANRQIEQAIQDRFHQTAIVSPVPQLPTLGRRSGVTTTTVMVPEMPPSPAAVLNQLGRDVAEAVRFYERINGPFPYDRLAVSQIPGTFGQGWPGLLYLSTFSFLTPYAQSRVGLSARAQEQFTELVPYHEVAHQWWGNLVSWANYRDQWILEGLANYLSLLYADSRKDSEHALATWLGRCRQQLLAKLPGQDATLEEAGPLVLGYRLRSSKMPNAFQAIVYSKGAWVFHMLRMMLRDPTAKDPDARFSQVLRSLLETHRYAAVTTEDLQRAVEQVMTPAMALEGGRSMDWFFDQWVRSTGIPRYSVEFNARPQANGFLVRGTLKQTGVPETFLASVPIYAVAGGKTMLLGTVVTSGEQTRFQFITRVKPKRLLIDPQQTLLCVTQ